MAKIKPFGLVMEIIAILAGVAMFVVGYIMFPLATAELWQFLLFAIGGGAFILIGMILFIIDIFRIGKEKEY
ncbi:hypothetical protein ES703_102189 [subsurface metagenome]